jgi:hypothetical protein
LKKVLSFLELEGQGRGIIMGVTRLLLENSPRAIYVLKSPKGPNIFGGSVLTLTFKKVHTGCSGHVKVSESKPIFEQVLTNSKIVCGFHNVPKVIVFDPLIWLKVTAMASTASNRKKSQKSIK